MLGHSLQSGKTDSDTLFLKCLINVFSSLNRCMKQKYPRSWRFSVLFLKMAEVINNPAVILLLWEFDLNMG